MRHRSRSPRMFALVVILLLACGASLAATACGSEGDEEQGAPPRALSLTMSDLAFEPETITVREGERVEVQLTNTGSMEHDFTIDDLPLEGLRSSGGTQAAGHAHHEADAALHIALAARDVGSLEFAATESGAYEYYCSVAGHREAGMSGVFVVE